MSSSPYSMDQNSANKSVSLNCLSTLRTRRSSANGGSQSDRLLRYERSSVSTNWRSVGIALRATKLACLNWWLKWYSEYPIVNSGEQSPDDRMKLS